MEKSYIKAYLYIIIAVFLWATIEIVMKLIQNNSSPFLMNFFRFFIGGFTLLFYAITVKKTKSIKKFLISHPKYYIPAALIGLAGGLLLYSFGTSLTEASMSAAIISSNPILISTYMIFFKGESKSPSKITGILLGFIGMLFIVTEMHFSAFFSNEYLLGNMLVLVGTCFWVVDLILGKLIMNKSRLSYQNHKENEVFSTKGTESQKVSSLDFNVLTFLLASLFMSPYLLVSDEWSVIVSQSLSTWLGLLYIGVVTTGIAYLLFFKGLGSLEASKGSNLFYLKPIFATILAVLVLDEIPSIYFYLGIILEVIALILISKN
ncbi:MAG: DMT family transporter [Candidatus Lokiarchaeota archaeon]|nr:DMT family transporter [Candidatus Harpocratesius repetitus]